MSEASTQHCPICGQGVEEVTAVAGVGGVCQACLLGGRFLGSTGAPRLQSAAEQALGQSPIAQALVSSALERAEELSRARQHDQARALLVTEADRHLAEGRPLLAAHLLYLALRLPGRSAEVYASLGQAARQMDCAREAAQHLKTAGWLAQKFEDRELVQRLIGELEHLAPEDGWLPRARAWLGEPRVESVEAAPEPTCGFCGRPASQVGELATGLEAAICQACLARLARGAKPS